jgi:TRAP-type mannitol/chloroaromatic compound transport system permease small subunit
MNAVIKIVDQMSETIGRCIAWLALLMMLLTAIIVIARYFFNSGSIAIQESIMYLHGALFMLGIGYTHKQGAHVRVDILQRNLSPYRQCQVDLIGFFIFLLPVALFLFFSSLNYVRFSWSLLESSGAPGGLPGIFLLKTLIPIMAICLLLQGIAEALKNVIKIRAENSA